MLGFFDVQVPAIDEVEALESGNVRFIPALGLAQVLGEIASGLTVRMRVFQGPDVNDKGSTGSELPGLGKLGLGNVRTVGSDVDMVGGLDHRAPARDLMPVATQDLEEVLPHGPYPEKVQGRVLGEGESDELWVGHVGDALPEAGHDLTAPPIGAIRALNLKTPIAAQVVVMDGPAVLALEVANPGLDALPT